MKERRSQLSRHFPEKPFQAPETIFKLPKLIGQKFLSYGHLLKDKRLKFTAKEDLNRQKEVFLLNFRPWPAQIPEIWSIFYGKKFI